MKFKEIVFIVVVSAVLSLLIDYYNTQDIIDHNEQASFETVEPSESGEVVR